MIIAQKILKNEDGSYKSEWILSAEQMSYLVTYAINDLLLLGIAEIKEEHNEAQMEFDFLTDVPKEALRQVQ